MLDRINGVLWNSRIMGDNAIRDVMEQFLVNSVLFLPQFF